MGFLLTLCAFSITVSGSLAFQTYLGSKSDLTAEYKYASRLSQLIATNLLKDNMEIDSNNVHSPLGVATILAILGEASDGETYKEFVSALNYPNSKVDLRRSFQHILQGLSIPSTGNPPNPSFKTWLYINHDQPARDEFKQVVANNYCVEIKSIKRSENDSGEHNTSLDTFEKTISNSKDIVGFEKLKTIDVSKLDYGKNDDVYNIKEASKFDKFVDDKQYVEASLIREQILQEKVKQKEPIKFENVDDELSITESEYHMTNHMTMLNESKKSSANIKPNEDNNAQENEIVHDSSVENGNPSTKQGSSEPQKVTIPLEKFEIGGLSFALQANSLRKGPTEARSILDEDDVLSAISGNSITGKENGSQTKMLLFNGLHYRGNWTYPFQELQPDPSHIFHLTKGQSRQTPMIYARGKYLVGDLKELNALTVSFPYEDERYSLLIVMPKDIEGLHMLIKSINSDLFDKVKSFSTLKDIFVTMPKFCVEETSRSENVLKTLGLRRLFTKGLAELSCLSDDPDLHVNEIVQFVSVKVDDGGSLAPELFRSNSVRAGISDEVVEQEFKIDHPFLYFIMDNEEDFVLLSGKITAPEFKSDALEE